MQKKTMSNCMSVNKNLIITILVIAFGNTLFGQQTKITDYVIFGGRSFTGQTPPLAPGYAVQLASSTTIQGGSIGSSTLVKTTGNSTIGSGSNPTNIFSGGTIQLNNSNVVSGRLAAGSSPTGVPGTVISVGSSATISGNIDANGNIVIGGGTVSGTVTIPSPGPPTYTYSGPSPSGSIVVGTPNLPLLIPPVMPADTSFSAPGSTNINSTRKISPGSYGNITLGGNKTLTFAGPGVYIFNSILNSGTSNIFNFNFQNKAGTIRIYVHGNVDLGKIKASTDSSATLNGPSALPESRVYLVTKGKGTSSDPVAFKIANGSSGNASKWVGTVWAPYAAINIGSGTGSTNVTGALWSGTQVNLQSGVFMVFAPFNFCELPIADAGKDKPLDFSRLTLLTVGSSTTTGASYSWQALNGGIIKSSSINKDSIYVSSAGTYVLTVTSSSASNCLTRDTVIVFRSLIGAELQYIYDSSITSSPFYVIQPDTVMIDVIANEGFRDSVYRLLQDPIKYGLRDTITNGTSNFIITGKFPINHLPNLNLLSTLINFCRPFYQGLTNNGLVKSAGDTSVRSWLVRRGYDLTGNGVKIGVISNSYNTILSPTTNPVKTNTAELDVSAGDLPGPGNPNGFIKPVQVLKDLSGLHSDEGRAMLQIAHDLAPEAELYFHTGSITAGDFAQGIRNLQIAGCNIVVDDITYITEAFLKDGVVAKAVDDVTALGTTYFSAAGNFASKSYEKDFNPVLIDNVSGIDPVNLPTGILSGKMAHDFGGSDIFQSVNLNGSVLSPGNYTIVLQWVDDIYSIGQTGGTKNNLDIYLTPNTDGTDLFGLNRDNTGGDPIEFLHFKVTSPTTTNILIINNTPGINPSRIKYVVFRGDITFNEFAEGTSTIVGQANAAGAIAIGAARYHQTDNIESFSSTGGTSVSGQSPRNKPELVGPDGVNTTVNLGGDYADPVKGKDGYSNFFGTSAAAPHAAAVAALIMEGRKKFLTPPPPSTTVISTSPLEMRTLLQSTAVDMLTPGFDFTSGYGFIDADAAMRSFANPKPFISNYQLENPNVLPGEQPVGLIINGNNFSSGTRVILGISDTLATTVNSFTQATTTLPVFTGDKNITLYTQPKSVSLLDGGLSNSISITGPAKKNIIVKANDISIKYAAQFPAFTSTIFVDGDSLQHTTLTLQDLGLTNILYETNATSTSGVGNYFIKPSRVFNIGNPADQLLLIKYNYTFTNGAFTIEKLPIRITANNIDNGIYGETLPNVGFTYVIPDITGIANPDSLRNVIINAHQNNLAKNAGQDILGLVNDQAVVIENDQAVVIENDQAVVIENNLGYAWAINDPRWAINNIRDTGNLIINSSELDLVIDTIINGLDTFYKVISTNGYELSSDDIANLSFLASEESLNNFRTVNSSQVIDITQESILWFKKNSALTYMLTSVPGVDRKGLVGVNSYTNEQAVVIENDQAVVIENDQAVVIENDQAVVIENDQAVVIENDQAVVIENSTTGEYYFINGEGNQVTLKSHERTAVIVDETELGVNKNDEHSVTKSLSVITGLDVGVHSIFPAALPGTASSNNFAVTYIPGRLTITDPCLLTRAPFNNFGSSPNDTISLWVNVAVKISGQLKAHDRYLLFTRGTISFHDIVAKDLKTGDTIKTKNLPNGKVIADSMVKFASQIYTRYVSNSNTWETHVPVGFSSTSDIFISGGIINSSKGFIKTKKNANSNTVVKGALYSDTVYSDQWTYALATYNTPVRYPGGDPSFDYPSVADSGKVVPINGNFRAGTPLPHTAYLVNGASGGGGNNYTGSTSSWDNFTACRVASPTVAGRGVNSPFIQTTRPVVQVSEEVDDFTSVREIQIIPNPATDFINLSFVSKQTGNSKIVLYSVHGSKVLEVNNGTVLKDQKYVNRIDVSKLVNGMYLVQIWNGNNITSKKIIISR
jgi:protein associated with RNAse G/E